MFRESLIDSALNRLSAHFGSHLVVHPPASADVLARLEHLVGPIPREYSIFLSTCDGLRIRGEGRETEWPLWGTHEALASIVAPPGLGAPPGFVPVRGDPTGERDWLIAAHGPAEGSVLRWDPWVPGAELIASSFGSYFRSWVRYVTQYYTTDGKRIAAVDRTPLFNARFCELDDLQLALLQTDLRVSEWLLEIDRGVACGDDYE